MPKYLLQASYTADGSRAVLEDGGAKRRERVERLVEGVGGRVEAFYFAFGECDALAIVDAPDNGTIVAHSLAINASGTVRLKTTAADSTGRCNSFREYIGWRPVAECLARPGVEAQRDCIEVLLRVDRQVRTPREVLS